VPSADQNPAARQLSWSPSVVWTSTGFWPSIIRTVVFEIVLLLALAGALVAYLDWSSQQNFTEFLAASKIQAAPHAPLDNVKSHMCERGA
jgi:hypothetical protein